ncbi:MAG TPA: fasciclin domain-containing protein, partial [Cryomorphaceae bacterium]|nr:fasciclin domain-containing protein [Cryomorphaceae bacterium]
LAQAVAAAELVDALNGEGPFTVFAPNDDAFNNLPDGMLDDLLADPTGDLQQILLYHVLGAEVLSVDIVPGAVTTLQGEDVELSIDGAAIFANDSEVILPDLTADNGVVHGIDAVMLPPSFVGLEELGANVPISVWPIPTSNELNVKFDDGNFYGTSLTIYDITGKVVEQINVNASQLTIQTNSWNAGYYFVRIDTPNNAYMQKIAVVK